MEVIIKFTIPSHIEITFTRPNAMQNPIASNDATTMISAPCHSSRSRIPVSPVIQSLVTKIN